MIDHMLMAWIECNIDIKQNELTQAEAKMWDDLFQLDEKQFYTYAACGFVQRRKRDGGLNCVSYSEVEHFCEEFYYKLQLALAYGQNAPALPLFDRVGRGVVMDIMMQQPVCVRHHVI